MEFTPKQMMAVALARQIENGKAYIVGTGLPLIGATLAKNTHAPDVKLIFETALFEGNPQEVPTSVSDLRVNYGASVLWPQYRYFGFQAIYSKRGLIAGGFLGGAQIDPYGNLNSTSIGNYFLPKARFTGSGGANGIATYCDTFIVMKHEKRRFIEHVDYVTSIGWGRGPEGRKMAGLDPSKGPRAVVTDMGIMRFDDQTKRMYLAEHFSGRTPQEIQENTGFDLDITRTVESECPSDEILEVLIRQVDPLRLMI